MDSPAQKPKTELDARSGLISTEGKPAKTFVPESVVRAHEPHDVIDDGLPVPENESLAHENNLVIAPSPGSQSPRQRQPRPHPSSDAVTSILPMESNTAKLASSPTRIKSVNQSKDGRPPRAPVGDANSHSKVTRERTKSPPISAAHENSIPSKVMDTMKEDQQMSRPQRSRGVSFGEEVFELSPKAPPRGVIEVPTTGQSVSPRPTPTGGTFAPSHMLLTTQISLNDINQVEKKLAMTDFVNPMETEAEKAILKALEDHECNSARSTPSIVFPNLPNDVLDDFQAQAHAVQQQQSSHEELASLRSSAQRSSFASIKTNPSMDKEKSKSSLLSGAQKVTQASVRLKHRPSFANSGEGSIESTLYNLASQMRSIQNDDDDPTDEKDASKASTTAVQSNVAVDALRNQSDVLANDAALLFRGRKRPLDPAGGVQVSSATTVSDPKKNDDIILEGDEAVLDHDVEQGNPSNQASDHSEDKPRRPGGAASFLRRTLAAAKDDLNYIDTFFLAKKKTATAYARSVLVYLILPATAASAVLFYGCGNPLMKSGMHPTTLSYPSISWFVLFLCVRQVITFSLAKLTELIIIDLLALKTRILMFIVGPITALLVVQSRGWPCTITFWAIFDLIMLSGEGEFANHWAFYQNVIGLFNKDNPSGGITSDPWNYRILIAAIVIGVVTAIKRFAVGMYLGGKQYSAYGGKLAEVMKKMILISEVAKLARKLERDQEYNNFHKDLKHSDWNFPSYGDELLKGAVDDDEGGSAVSKSPRPTDDINLYNKSFKSSERFKLIKLLDQWEEPIEEQSVDTVSISGILNFKQNLEFMDLSFPFSKAFGLADTREHCVQSAESVYKRLLCGNTQGDVLHFETLAVLASTPGSQEMDDNRLKEIVRVFRPERDGTLDTVAFVRSVDQVYKDFKLLRASIRNSTQIDSAFEAIMNIAFYFIVFCIVLASWGIDPLAMFLSLSSVILAFSFAIGSASAKYFEGVMFIIGRNPYDIGDRISINSPNEPPLADGVFTWYVEEVTLYYTTVRLGATNEVATIANNALANSRIVNAARSKKAMVYIKLKFGIDVPFSKIQVFKEAVEAFVKGRPREWLNCSSIRSTRVEADLGFIEYVVSLLHRDSWQQIGSIMESKAAVMSFCLEVQKKLGMRYVAPPTPVDLTMKNPQSLSSLFQGAEDMSRDSPGGTLSPLDRARTQSADLRSVADMFSPGLD